MDNDKDQTIHKNSYMQDIRRLLTAKENAESSAKNIERILASWIGSVTISSDVRNSEFSFKIGENESGTTKEFLFILKRVYEEKAKRIGINLDRFTINHHLPPIEDDE